MSDFFEIPRPKPNSNLETLDMKALGFVNMPTNKQSPPIPENDQIEEDHSNGEKPGNDDIIGFSQDSEHSGNGNADVELILQRIAESKENDQEKNQDRLSNNENDDEKETYHESLGYESNKKALQIIEENIQSIKKEESQSDPTKKTVSANGTKKKQLANNAQLSKKIQNIIDFGENDLGEVGEWVEKTANCNKKDDEVENSDSDFEDVFENTKDKNENLPKSSRDTNEDRSNNKGKQETSSNTNIEKFGIGKTTNKKSGGGYMMNNLKEKAQSMLLAQGVPTNPKNESLPKLEHKNEDAPKKLPEEEKKLIEEHPIQEKHHAPKPMEEIENYSHRDWEEISKRNLEKLNNSNIRMHSEEDVSPIFFPEMWQIVKTLDLSREKKNIVTTTKDNLSFFDRLFYSCSMTKLPPNLLLERDQIFAYAKVPFDDKNPLHLRMLTTIYQKLTDLKLCVRYGDHWEKIGFQGRDPATDLRGVGMLGVLQILAFISLNFDFIKYVYNYSLDDIYHFPLAVGLLNMTEIMLQTLREGKLHNVILHQKSVINAVNAYYFAVFFKFFVMYKTNKCMESDFGELKKSVAELAKKNPSKLIADYIKEKELFCKTNL